MAGLEDLYREIIIDHYRSPRNRGELDTPPATRTEGFNLCGDEIVVYLQLGEGEGDDRHRGDPHRRPGCSISQSSAPMMSTAVNGKTIAEAREVMRAFKAMMSIHESALDDSVEEPDIADIGEPARRPRGDARRREVSRSHQVRDVVEHPRSRASARR